jgi:hypothetical protein
MPRGFSFGQIASDLSVGNLRPLLLLPPAAVIESCQSSSKKSQRRRLGHGIRSRRERKDYAVIPEVTIRIEAKGDVASVQEVGAQNLKLIGRERVNVVRGGHSKRRPCQKSVGRAGRDQGVVEIARTSEIIDNLRRWHRHARRVSERSHSRVFRCIQQVKEQPVWVAVPVADVSKRDRSTRNRLASQIDAANFPRVGLVVIQIKLARSAAALIGRGNRCLESDGVG